MITDPKQISRKLLLKKSYQLLTADDVREARDYIHEYWQELERYNPEDTDSLIGLPNAYIIPASEESHAFDFNEMYYWDCYFICKGLLDDEHKDMVVGILDNLLYLQKRFKIIPNANRTYLMGRSQPPFLTSFILDVFNTYNLSTKWLTDSMDIARSEYETVWMGDKKPHDRLAHEGLSRYYDINYLHDLAEAESGWDMTPRFGRKALNFLPVDLNALLYKYEVDFAYVAKILGDDQGEVAWSKKAETRKLVMNQLMWSDLRGMYYDYDFRKQKRGVVSSLAAYFPMWAGMVSDTQAKKLVANLWKFEEKGGLAATDQQLSNRIPTGLQLNAVPQQWGWPNGWAPLHLIVIEGLEKYGYHEQARRITFKWLNTNLDWYNANGTFLEKYNVVQPTKPPVKGVYPSQVGFGWTNAVFERLCQQYIGQK